MREIKFRAWDTSKRLTEDYINWCNKRKLYLGGELKVIEKQVSKYEKETGKSHLTGTGIMIYDIHISNKGKMMDFEGGWDYFGDNDNAIVMQFTGLHDKNGKDIYEGDILSYPREEQVISIRWDETGANWQFDEHLGLDDGAGRGDWNFTLGIAKQCEVIGNICENLNLTK